MDINLYKDSYGDFVREAIGRNTGPDLSLCCARERQPDSDTYLIPSWKMKAVDAADPTTFAKRGKTRDTFSRDDWENLAPADRTMENWLKMRTPHQKIEEFYTVSNSQTIKGGHQFKKEKQIVMGNDPTSRTVTGIGQMVFDQRQDIFLEALTAATVQRKVGTNTFAAALPASQVMATAGGGVFDVKKDLPKVKSVFRKANVPDTKNIWALINTDDCADFETFNFEKIYNLDYVEGRHLRDGTIPAMFGVKWIPTNLIPRGMIWFWLYEALSWVPYSPLEHDMAKSPGDDFDVFFKIAEHGDCKRIDDLGVLKCNITA